MENVDLYTRKGIDLQQRDNSIDSDKDKDFEATVDEEELVIWYNKLSQNCLINGIQITKTFSSYTRNSQQVLVEVGRPAVGLETSIC